MGDEAHYSVFVSARPAVQTGVIALARPSTRTQAPSIRATAIVFDDPASVAVKEQLDRLAPSDASIVIIGETGTGKEIVARYLHEHSTRRGGPFVAVNCGALVDSLVEAELFGYEKGAFTGAIKTQVGWFEAANGGTLLLDEVGDLPAPLQVKLLRVLQEREVVRLGARTPIPVDVRVIAATNIDLESAVATGAFRQDLFFRLNVATLKLPPLRQRPDDIRQLSRHFLELYAEKLGRPELHFSRATVDALVAHAWPGNIRELENVVHNAVLLARGPSIEPAVLRLARTSVSAAGPNLDEDDATVEARIRRMITEALAAGEPQLFERVANTVITAAFEENKGNQVRAAEQLGISRNAMRTHLGRLGVIARRSSRKSAP